MSESKHTPEYCDWCNGHHETLPLGMCRLHQHAPGLLEACKAALPLVRILTACRTAAGVEAMLVNEIARAEGRE